MTGYGKSSIKSNGIQVDIEARSLNHRYLDIAVHAPRQVLCLEDDIRKMVAQHIHRGRVDIFIDIKYTDETAFRQVKVDKGLCLAYYNALRELQAELGLYGNIDISDIFGIPEVISIENTADISDIQKTAICSSIQGVLAQITSMREKEGQNISKEILTIADDSYRVICEIEDRSQVSVDEYRCRLSARISEIIPPVQVDENRLAQEIVLFSEKTNITEEIGRLKSHLQMLDDTIRERGPIGRKIDFIIQEMNREINTIGSKSADMEISRRVISMKGYIDSLREQIQNIE